MREDKIENNQKDNQPDLSRATYSLAILTMVLTVLILSNRDNLNCFALKFLACLLAVSVFGASSSLARDLVALANFFETHPADVRTTTPSSPDDPDLELNIPSTMP